ncbi:MAG: hypothetical protein GIKADHBN_02703 [Phycisphaerales bacterium]|nr:hypothetical protein [Phycisphaerales bacterium]MCK6477644.1 hypothetical protein [Phycisphaerales bacterium]
MGTWTLERLTTEFSDYDTSELFGTNFKARFWLAYTPTAFDRFAETPRLDWHELILMKEHHNNQWWEFETNMYEHNPLSNTLKVWPGRYVIAYDTAAGEPPFGVKGRSELLDRGGMRVAIDKLGAGISDNAQKADAVRSYLKKHGGILMIEVHDIPSINKPTGNQHKERLLKFNVGVAGSVLRAQAEQYLVVNHAQPKAAWTRRFSNGWPTAWNPGAAPKVAAPASVSNPRDPVFAAGECW